MKTLTKEQVYVLIENQADCDIAIEILTKAGEKLWQDESAFKFSFSAKHLRLSSCDNDWYIGSDSTGLTEITLDELESLLTQKIKESELLNRIEMLEKKVADLEEKSKVTIVYPPTWATEPGSVIGKGTIEVEADKPQFEVGKVYKLDLAMFYCTKIKDGKPYGFGFDFFGNWCEEDGIPFSGNLTEATPEEWFKRLEEEAKERGFVKGVRFNSPNSKASYAVNQTIIIDKIGYESFQDNFYIYCERSDKNKQAIIMEDGKWAEIIEEPQSERYNMTKDQNAQIDCRMTECEFNNGVGHCLNISPAITLNDNKSFVCWSSSESE